MPHPSQRGIALLMAVIILSGLLMLALPFIFSQSMALSGSRRFAARMNAITGQDSARDIGLGPVEEALDTVFQDASKRRSVLDVDINDLDPNIASLIYGIDSPHLIDINLQQMGLDGTRPGATLFGLSLEEEGGKIDVNDLNEEQWARLLNAVGLPAARAASLYRYRYLKYYLQARQEQRIFRLDELLRSSYEQLEWQNPPANMPSASDFLQRHELARLRPYLTAHGRGQGREGLADLGTALHVGRRVEFRVEITNTGSDSRRVRITGSFGGHSRSRIRNFDPGETRTERFSFWVSNLIGPTPQITLSSVDGADDLSQFDVGQPFYLDPQNNNQRVNGDALKRLVIQFDGPIDQALGRNSVLVLEDLQDSSNDPAQSRNRFYLPDNVEIEATSIAFQAADPLDPIQQSLDDWSQGKTLLAAAREVPHAPNIFHLAQPLRQVLDLGDFLPDPESVSLQPDTLQHYHRLRALRSDGITGLRQHIPAGLRSWGVFSSLARASAGDSAGRPSAAVRRHSMVQAVGPLRLEWQSKADFDILLGNSGGGPVVLWPANTKELNLALNRQPEDRDEQRPDPTVVPTFAEDGMLRPAPLATWAERLPSQPSSDWARPFSQRPLAERLSYDTRGSSQDPISGDISHSSPEGLRVSDQLRYEIGSAGPLRGSPEIGGRWLQLWLRFDQPPGAGESVLLEFRGEQTFPQLDGTEGESDYQNLWQLVYDGRDGGWLRLRLANAAIERTNSITRAADDFSHFAPVDDPERLYSNEESLGSDAPGSQPLAPEVPVNRVEFVYKVDSDFTDPERWQHLSIIVAHDRPGGQAILLNGLAGRDLLAHPHASARPGDHCVIPAVVLNEDLEAHDLVGNNSGAGLAVDRIAVRVPAGISGLGYTGPADILPSRGTVLIGNEYISYGRVSGNSLEDCFRGLRANSNTTSANENQRWPNLQEHFRGDLVVPGGFRYRPGTWRLYTGSARSQHTFYNGDTSPASPHRFQVWSRIDSNRNAHMAVPDEHAHRYPSSSDPWHIFITDREYSFNQVQADGSTITIEMQANTSLPLEDGVIDQFPENGGIIIVSGNENITDNSDNLFFYYASRSGSVLEGLEAISIPGRNPVSNGVIRWDSQQSAADATDAPLVMLLSLAVEGDNLDDSQAFAQASGSPSSTSDTDLIQIEDPLTGRIEWLRYHRIIQHDERWFFFNHRGWSGGAQDHRDRGQQRTIFAGDYEEVSGASGTLDADSPFPAGSYILPVQTRMGRSHWLVSGDVVTLMPDDINAVDPRQMVIRFAATDAYFLGDEPPPAHPHGAEHDTKNEWFTFTEAVDPDYAQGDFEMLAGLCWSGIDLSSLGPIPFTQTRNGLMPSLRGSDNPNLAIVPDAPIELGALMAGLQRGVTADSTRLGQVQWFVRLQRNGLEASAEYHDSLPSNLNLQSGEEWYVGMDVNSIPNTTNLIRIGGEIFAATIQRVWNNPSSSQDRGTLDRNKRDAIRDAVAGAGGDIRGTFYARLIGRGLLGSEPQEHRVRRSFDPNNPGNTLFVAGPQVLHLPTGPVGRLSNDLEPDFLGSVETSDGNNLSEDAIPAWMLLEADGSAVEMISLPGGRSAPWLRGMWGSTVRDWRGIGQAEDIGPLIVGWWPRYPSSLPQSSLDLDQDPNHRSAHLRSRAYAWVGFPVHLLDVRPEAILLEMSGGESVYAGLNDGGFAWELPNSGTAVNIPAERAPQGFEARLWWREQNAPSNDFREVVGRMNRRRRGIRRAEIRAESSTILLEQDMLR